jgi:DNA-binding HxlR family transcriptional regulator
MRRKLQETTQMTGLANRVKRLDEDCKYCKPLSPLTCVRDCSVWRLRRELNHLRKILLQNNYRNLLLNVLKNKRRVLILKSSLKRGLTLTQLQRELKRARLYHSQQTILNEYVNPLISVGLVQKHSNRFKTTNFGSEILKTLRPLTLAGFPPHSGCYEEKIIEVLAEGPKTSEGIKLSVPTESLQRVLNRLHQNSLIEKKDGNTYIYYFKTKRNPKLEELSTTAKRIYDKIPLNGATAKNLARDTHIPIRRVYKNLRKLRGKKLVFKRKLLKTYSLTKRGAQLAEFLQDINLIITEFLETSLRNVEKLHEPTSIGIQTPDQQQEKALLAPLSTYSTR